MKKILTRNLKKASAKTHDHLTKQQLRHYEEASIRDSAGPLHTNYFRRLCACTEPQASCAQTPSPFNLQPAWQAAIGIMSGDELAIRTPQPTRCIMQDGEKVHRDDQTSLRQRCRNPQANLPQAGCPRRACCPCPQCPPRAARHSRSAAWRLCRTPP